MCELRIVFASRARELCDPVFIENIKIVCLPNSLFVWYLQCQTLCGGDDLEVMSVRYRYLEAFLLDVDVGHEYVV